MSWPDRGYYDLEPTRYPLSPRVPAYPTSSTRTYAVGNSIFQRASADTPRTLAASTLKADPTATNMDGMPVTPTIQSSESVPRTANVNPSTSSLLGASQRKERGAIAAQVSSESAVAFSRLSFHSPSSGLTYSRPVTPVAVVNNGAMSNDPSAAHAKSSGLSATTGNLNQPSNSLFYPGSCWDRQLMSLQERQNPG